MRKLTLILVIVSLVFAGAALSFAQNNYPVVIGFVADQSGLGALFYGSQEIGVQIAIEQLNEDGGILGRPVEVIARDAQFDPSFGANLARQMILEDEVDFLLGPTSSSVALAISEIAREQEVVVAFHTSNSAALSTTNGHPFMVQVVPNTTIESRAVAMVMADLGFTDIASIGPDYAYGRDSFSAFQPRLEELNSSASVIIDQWPALSERDLNPFITAIQANAPQAIYSILWGEQLVNFVQQGLDQGLFDEATVIGLYDTDFMKSIGNDLPDGLLGYARAPFYAIDTPEMEAFVQRYLELSGGDYPSDWAIMAYDAVMALAAGAEAAGTTDGPAVAEVLGGLSFDSLRGELTIRDCDRMANVGEYIGITTNDSEFPFPILTDVIFIPAEQLWDSCEDIEAMRAEAG